jgi:hypothetical protein
MESNDELDSRYENKGKSIDKGYNEDSGESVTKPLDKGKGIDRTVHPLHLGPGHCTEPPFVT